MLLLVGSPASVDLIRMRNKRSSSEEVEMDFSYFTRLP